MNKKVQDYQRLFELNGLSFLTSTLFMGVYKDLEALTISQDGIWRAYIPLTSIEKAGADGLALYGSKEKYAQYKLDLEAAYEGVRDTCEACFTKQKLLADDVRACVEACINYLRYYQKTEFFYTDKAFEMQDGNPEMKDNLLSFGDLKLRGREYLNTIYFGENAYFTKLVSKVAGDLSLPAAEVWSRSIDGIPGLYDGGVFDADRIAKAEAFCSWYENSRIQHTFGAEARKHIAEFLGTAEKHEVLRGKTASKGKITARARVFNFGLAEFDHAYKWVKVMEQGEVLVAETTSPEIIVACQKASAIITNQGGMMSHAAIVSRELGIPCIVGTNTATDDIQTGDLIEVNADEGVVHVIERAQRD